MEDYRAQPDVSLRLPALGLDHHPKPVLDFTGEYVVHCHFLGHEDHGMMIGVQTICPSTPQWGTTVPAGTADNCSLNLPASPQCPN